ncbi:DUF3558 family protein [Corynebacterium sp.]|uniref:DUF3558 family protein n=1 Tax=Corynebacterium sp. TaxID=1720 RepID=UPI0026DCD92F|nr:DUF3558 family protein [Corynebacterium sp.]MDO5032827.1 DUF3558 family protein [Corynebacterium sp.]
MKHYGVAAAALVSMGVLAGCVAPLGTGDVASDSRTGGAPDSLHEGEGEVPAVSGAAGASAIEAEGATLGDAHSSSVLPPLGPFDPTEPGFSLFDPCTEIPQEVFQELGFDKQVNAPMRDTGVAHCGYKDLEGAEYVGFGATDYPIENYRLAFGEATKIGNESLPAFSFEEGEYDSLFCTLYMETARGTIIVSSTGTDLSLPKTEKCEHAYGVLSRLANY